MLLLLLMMVILNFTGRVIKHATIIRIICTAANCITITIGSTTITGAMISPADLVHGCVHHSSIRVGVTTTGDTIISTIIKTSAGAVKRSLLLLVKMLLLLRREGCRGSTIRSGRGGRARAHVTFWGHHPTVSIVARGLDPWWCGYWTWRSHCHVHTASTSTMASRWTSVAMDWAWGAAPNDTPSSTTRIT